MNYAFYIIFVFIIYSFIGWIIEKLYSFYKKNTFKNEGFLYGPLKPMYGVAMAGLVIIHEIGEFISSDNSFWIWINC